MPTSTQAHNARPPRGRQARETRDAQRYLRALFEREQPGALIELRYRYRSVMRQRFLPAAELFTAARTIVRLGINTDVYVGVAPRQQAAGDKNAIQRVWTLWADLDNPDTHPALKALPVAPALLLASGIIRSAERRRRCGRAHRRWRHVASEANLDATRWSR